MATYISTLGESYEEDLTDISSLVNITDNKTRLAKTIEIKDPDTTFKDITETDVNTPDGKFIFILLYINL